MLTWTFLSLSLSEKNGGTLKNLASLALRVSFAKRLFLPNPLSEAQLVPHGVRRTWGA